MRLDHILNLRSQVPLRRHQGAGLGVVDADLLALPGHRRLGRGRLLMRSQVLDEHQLADVVHQARHEQHFCRVLAELARLGQRLRCCGHARRMEPQALGLMSVAREVALHELRSAGRQHEAAHTTEAEDHDRFLDSADRTVQAIERRVDHGQHLGHEHLVILHQALEILRLGLLAIEDTQKTDHEVRKRRDQVTLVHDLTTHFLLLGELVQRGRARRRQSRILLSAYAGVFGCRASTTKVHLPPVGAASLGTVAAIGASHRPVVGKATAPTTSRRSARCRRQTAVPQDSCLQRPRHPCSRSGRTTSRRAKPSNEDRGQGASSQQYP